MMADPIRQSTETIGPHAIRRWVQEADDGLRKAEALTGDTMIRDHIRRARKELGSARRRAEQLYNHARDRELAPPELEL